MCTGIGKAEVGSTEVSILEVALSVLWINNILQIFDLERLVADEERELFWIFFGFVVFSKFGNLIIRKSFRDSFSRRLLINDWFNWRRKCKPEVEIVRFQILKENVRLL